MAKCSVMHWPEVFSQDAARLARTKLMMKPSGAGDNDSATRTCDSQTIVNIDVVDKQCGVESA
jgi:hypothetical protein